VVTEVHLPPGMLGPDPVTFEVRCFVVADSSGVVLIDTCAPDSTAAIGTALAQAGASWSDVSDIVLTHHHFDHTGGLAESAGLASGANIWAGAQDAPEIRLERRREVRAIAEGDSVRNLDVLDTPGHTAGHISLLDEAAGVVFIGDLIGSSDGDLDFGPPAFTADPDSNRRSLRRVVDLAPQRLLFSHGEEITDPNGAIRQLLDQI
jgi:glyoxylase-like metal-dependent hydrolase (beta-lactamase superfamily II)